MAQETLQNKKLGDITWLETGLRDVSNKACREVLRWLMALPDLQVPEDSPSEGERRIPDQSRSIFTLFGQIPVSRTYYYHSGKGGGRYPLDEALDLIDGYTPAITSLICRCAAHHPFGRASEAFHAYTGLDVDSRQFQRLAERVGPIMDKFLRSDIPSGEKKPPRVYVASDGTGAPLRHEELKGRKGRQPDGTAQTHEIKVGCVFTQHPVMGQDPWRDLDSTTYVTTTERSEAFGGRLRSEFMRRFQTPPDEIVYLGDGAAWNWEIQRTHFPEAIGIADFYHAAEHVGRVVDIIEDRHSPLGRQRLKRWIKLLLRDGLDRFIKEAQVAIPPEKQEVGKKALAYFEKNRERMSYGTFQRKGFFIGSGVVEAACKTIVAQRLKGSGMHWSTPGLNNILNLRTAILSRRYDHFWSQLHQLLHAA